MTANRIIIFMFLFVLVLGCFWSLDKGAPADLGTRNAEKALSPYQDALAGIAP